MFKNIKLPILASLLTLTSCGNGAPSKEEVQNLIIKEGLPYAERQVIYKPWCEIFWNTFTGKLGTVAFDKRAFMRSSEAKLGSVKVNESSLKNYIKHDMSVENVQCKENANFKKFYNCSVSIKYNSENNFYLKTYDIMFNRTDNGSLSEVSTNEFVLQPIGYQPYHYDIYRGLGKNLFSTLKSSQYAPSSETRSVYIPDKDGNAYNINNENDSLIENKQFYRDLIRELTTK